MRLNTDFSSFRDVAYTVQRLQTFMDRFHFINGDPNGQVMAPVGHIALRLDGSTSTTLYVKETGSSNTGWVAK